MPKNTEGNLYGPDLQRIFGEVRSLIEETAAFVREERSRWTLEDLKFKGDKSLLTSIDVATENRLISGLKKILPEAGFLAEESFSQASVQDLMWIIDPIDGTTNLVHNFPMYCISLALYHKGKVVMGIICEISSNETFWAHDGQEGAWLNDKRVEVSAAATLGRSIVATGFPPGEFGQIDEYLRHFRFLMENSQGLRRLGSAAMDLAYVSCGRCDGFFEYNLNPWDIAAGAYLVQKAGGQVTDFKGGDNYLFGKQILATNHHIHNEFLTQFIKN